MDPIETLLAIEEIKTLKARYFYTLDSKDWAAYGALFTPDAAIDFTGHKDLTEGDGAAGVTGGSGRWVFTGGQELAAWIEPLFANTTSVHHGHDPQVTIEGPNAARAIWAMYDRLETPGETFHGYGHYHESYVRVAGQWLISALRLTRLMGAVEPSDGVLLPRAND